MIISVLEQPPELFYKKNVLKNFVKFTGNKVAGQMVKHTQAIRWQQPTNCLSVFDHLVLQLY